jgi:hypothetical protein
MSTRVTMQARYGGIAADGFQSTAYRQWQRYWELLQMSLGIPTEDVGRRKTGMGDNGAGLRYHDVSQRGCGRGGCGERGQRPIWIMRPAQTGQRSMRCPVRISTRSR